MLFCPHFGYNARNVLTHSVLATLISVGSHAAYAGEKDEIVTDRPDFVESSEVVGKGRFQFETSLQIERNKADGRRDRTFSMPTLLRLGVSDTLELRLETDGRTVFRSEDASTGQRETMRGYSDVALGAKWHLLDRNGSVPSVGLLFDVTLDSGSKAFRGEGLRPSLRVPIEWDLPNDLSVGLMPGLTFDKRQDGKRFTSGIFAAVLGKGWTDRFRTFVEVAASQITRSENGGNIVTFDVGAAYLLTDLVQIDTALYRGLNKNTPDLALTVGLSVKF